MLAAGLYLPSPENLAKIRQEIDYNGERLNAIINDRTFKKTFGKFWDEDKLKTMPKGYAKDHPHVAFLKLKSFLVLHSFADSDVMDKKFLNKLIHGMKSAKPLNDFLMEGLA